MDKAGERIISIVSSLSELLEKVRDSLRVQTEKTKQAEKRAEVAERQAILLSKWLAEKTRKDYPWQAWFDEAQKQAEKEFAEEDKR